MSEEKTTDFDLDNVALIYLIVLLCMPITSGTVLSLFPFLLYKLNKSWCLKFYQALITLAVVQILIYTPVPSLSTCLVLLAPLCLSDQSSQ